MTLNRREFVQLAAAMGASLAWGGSARASTTGWHERRDLYPEGVASGDPDPSSVILWTRRPFESGGRRVLTVEVAEDDAFRRVVAKASAPARSARSSPARRRPIRSRRPRSRGNLSRAFATSADEIEAIEPPDNVAELHGQLVDGMRGLSDRLREAQRALAGGNAQRAAEAAADLQRETSKAQARIQDLIDRINAELES